MSGTPMIPLYLSLVQGWYAERLGREMPDPFAVSPAEMGRYHQDRERAYFDALGDLGPGIPDPPLEIFTPQHDMRNIIAVAFGAPLPEWDGLSGSFWLSKDAHAWAGLSTMADIERIAIPDWEENPLVRQAARKWDEVQALLGDGAAKAIPSGWTHVPWRHPVSGLAYDFVIPPAFIDLGSFLMGCDDFFALLGTEPELADALLRRCFDISMSLKDYLVRLYRRSYTGWGCLGGDNACMLSPAMYRRYAQGFDALARAHYGNIPRVLHSCGASKHLYAVWAEYPERERIVLMQTRAIPGEMRALRAALPHTFLQLTIHQPQTDFERETPDTIRALVWEYADALEYRDMDITVILSRVDGRVRENLSALHDAMAGVNAEAGRRARR